jgi:hypothetical protein
MAVKRGGGALAALLAAGGLWAWQNRDKIQGWINDPNTRSKVQGWLGGMGGTSSTSSTSRNTGGSLSDHTYSGSPSSTNQFGTSSGQFDSNNNQFGSSSSPATGETRRIGSDINNPTQTPDDPFKAGI